MKALQHTEVPSSSTSSASKSTKAQGKPSQPKRGMPSSEIDQTAELETSQATATESSASASAAAESSALATASALESALGIAAQDMDINLPVQEVGGGNRHQWEPIKDFERYRTDNDSARWRPSNATCMMLSP